MEQGILSHVLRNALVDHHLAVRVADVDLGGVGAQELARHALHGLGPRGREHHSLLAVRDLKQPASEQGRDGRGQ